MILIVSNIMLWVFYSHYLIKIQFYACFKFGDFFPPFYLIIIASLQFLLVSCLFFGANTKFQGMVLGTTNLDNNYICIPVPRAIFIVLGKLLYLVQFPNFSLYDTSNKKAKCESKFINLCKQVYKFYLLINLTHLKKLSNSVYTL